MKTKWYDVKNVTDDSAEIAIYGEIGSFGVSAKGFISELRGLGDRRVTLRIHSPGGEVLEGTAIYNALRRHKGGVDVAIDGMAASMATVIAMAGERRSMAANGWFVIHNPFSGAVGESKDFRKQADLLDSIKGVLVDTYAGRTGMDRADISEMMDEETWMNAEQAKEYGFITDITEPLAAAASIADFSLSRFDKVPKDIMAKPALLSTIAAAIGFKPEDAEESSVLAEIKNLFALKDANAALVAERDGLKNTVVEKDAEIVGYTAKIGEQGAEIVNLTASVTNLTSERDTAVTAKGLAETNLKNLKASLGIKAADVVPVVPEGLEKSPSELLEQYNKISDPVESARFYEQHKDALTKAAYK